MVALCGYTNAGKSSLLNAVTDANVLVENKLFATLDPTVRLLTLADKRSVLLSDTVGFINKLPHSLVEAFKSTLDEVKFADLIVMVVDASDENYRDHIEVVRRLLVEIGAAEKPMICALNKWDAVEDRAAVSMEVPGALETVAISVKTGYHIEELISFIGQYALGRKEKIELLLPYREGNLLNQIHENFTIESEAYEENGVHLVVWLDEIMYRRVSAYEVKKEN